MTRNLSVKSIVHVSGREEQACGWHFSDLVTGDAALIQVYTADVPSGFHVYCIKVQLSWAIAYLRIKNTNF